LYRLEFDGSCSTVLTALAISDGIGWSPGAGPAWRGFRPIHRVFTLNWVTRRGPSSHDNQSMDKRMLSRGLPGPGLP